MPSIPFYFIKATCRRLKKVVIARCVKPVFIVCIVPTLRRGNAAGDALASRNAGALQDDSHAGERGNYRLQILIKEDARMNLETRITYNPLQCGGKPCVRGMRIRVGDILQMLGEGVSSEEILQDFPDLEPQDIQACLLYAARRVNLERLAA